jgi:hypothetical protein
MSPVELDAFYRRAETLELDPGSAWRQYCVFTRLLQLHRLRLVPRGLRGARALDFGGGSGFVPAALAHRLGWDTVCFEPYVTPAFSPQRVQTDWSGVESKGPYRVVIATEVFEHLTRPAEEFNRLGRALCAERAVVYVTTGLYQPGVHDASWSYLAPQSGQHVCLYAKESILRAAHALGCDRVLNVGRPYEWLLIRGRTSWLRRTTDRLRAAALRGAVARGMAVAIE